ncbi:MAG: Tm-1-like ATP-binding domain-containing protein [Planctomycetota bacterium]|jgi:uncharacterized protein (UPF0261 family)
MSQTIAILATLDTKGKEAAFLREQLEELGSRALLIDVGVVGQPGAAADRSREQVAEAAGTSLAALLDDPSREEAAPTMARGAGKIVADLVKAGELQGIIGLGGLQGTALCCQVMRALPYGFPKIMLSTVASGDTSAYVDIMDITMMFSVGDILGLNPLMRRALANAAGAAHGMALSKVALPAKHGGKPVIGMSNLGVLTSGAMQAIEYFEDAGYEVIVFHAVGSGGRAMEQMMKEGIIGAVFDYALGEIADEVHGGLRAGGEERLTVAGQLGLPQVICPGGAEHLGILVDPPNSVPERFAEHTYVFHNPVVFVPRLKAEECKVLAQDIGRRLQHSKEKTVFMIPLGGTGSYARKGGALHDPESDRVFFAELEASLPETVELVKVDTHAEDPAFVRQAVDRLIALIEGK